MDQTDHLVCQWTSFLNLWGEKKTLLFPIKMLIQRAAESAHCSEAFAWYPIKPELFISDLCMRNKREHPKYLRESQDRGRNNSFEHKAWDWKLRTLVFFSIYCRFMVWSWGSHVKSQYSLRSLTSLYFGFPICKTGIMMPFPSNHDWIWPCPPQLGSKIQMQSIVSNIILNRKKSHLKWVKALDPKSRSWLCHRLPWSWTNHSIFLCFGFSLVKWE